MAATETPTLDIYQSPRNKQLKGIRSIDYKSGVLLLLLFKNTKFFPRKTCKLNAAEPNRFKVAFEYFEMPHHHLEMVEEYASKDHDMWSSGDGTGGVMIPLFAGSGSEITKKLKIQLLRRHTPILVLDWEQTPICVLNWLTNEHDVCILNLHSQFVF